MQLLNFAQNLFELDFFLHLSTNEKGHSKGLRQICYEKFKYITGQLQSPGILCNNECNVK